MQPLMAVRYTDVEDTSVCASPKTTDDKSLEGNHKRFGTLTKGNADFAKKIKGTNKEDNQDELDDFASEQILTKCGLEGCSMKS